MSTKNRHSIFIHKCLFKIPLWRKIDNASSCFIISSKNLKWKQHFHADKKMLKKMKKKSVTFTKGKSKFLQNQRGEGDFSVETLGLFFQSNGNVKREIITRNWTQKLPHKLPNNLGLMAVGNEEGFNVLMILELVDSNSRNSWTRTHNS